jgi:P27 family predicted phage terminase small subunit
MGRNKIPDEIKQMRGTLRKHRVNADQIQPEKITEMNEVPEFLNKYGRVFYKKYFKLFSDMGILATTDLESLALMAAEYGKYYECQMAIKSEGYVTRGTNKQGASYEMTNPHIAISNAAFKNYTALLIKFGLSPADRSRVSVTKEDLANEGEINIEDFLN